jgi:hypothetical protein
MSIIAIVYFLLFIVLRAYITKYLLAQFAIHTSSLSYLFKRYFLIALIINVPFILIGVLIYYGYSDLSEKFDMLSNSTLIIPVFYLIEAFLITKIIKDKKRRNITFKIALMLVLIFFITDTVLDQFYSLIEEALVNEVNTLFEDQVSSALGSEQ